MCCVTRERKHRRVGSTHTRGRDGRAEGEEGERGKASGVSKRASLSPPAFFSRPPSPAPREPPASSSRPSTGPLPPSPAPRVACLPAPRTANTRSACPTPSSFCATSRCVCVWGGEGRRGACLCPTASAGGGRVATAADRAGAARRRARERTTPIAKNRRPSPPPPGSPVDDRRPFFECGCCCSVGGRRLPGPGNGECVGGAGSRRRMGAGRPHRRVPSREGRRAPPCLWSRCRACRLPACALGPPVPWSPHQLNPRDCGHRPRGRDRTHGAWWAYAGASPPFFWSVGARRCLCVVVPSGVCWPRWPSPPHPRASVGETVR